MQTGDGGQCLTDLRLYELFWGSCPRPALMPCLDLSFSVSSLTSFPVTIAKPIRRENKHRAKHSQTFFPRASAS